MRYKWIVVLLLGCVSACGDFSSTSDESPDVSPGDTKCQAPDMMVNVGEACDMVLRDCGNVLCAQPLECVDAICVSVTDAGPGTSD